MAIVALPAPMPVFDRVNGVWRVPGMTQVPTRISIPVKATQTVYSGEPARQPWKMPSPGYKNHNWKYHRAHQYR